MKKKLILTENNVKDIVKRYLDKIAAWSFAPVQRGLGAHGIPDRVACVPVVITPAMVGQTVGLFVGIEAKRPGRRGEKLAGASHGQFAQLNGILAAGGAGALVDGEEDMERVLNNLATIRNGYAVTNLFSSDLLLRVNHHG